MSRRYAQIVAADGGMNPPCDVNYFINANLALGGLRFAVKFGRCSSFVISTGGPLNKPTHSRKTVVFARKRRGNRAKLQGVYSRLA